MEVATGSLSSYSYANQNNMKYYVFVTNASNYNSLHEFDSLQDTEKFCEDASRHNSCYIIKGEEKRFYRRKKKSEPREDSGEPF